MTKTRLYSLRETNRQRLRTAVAVMGVELDGLIDSATAFALLRELGYAACRERFDYHRKIGLLDPPPKVLGHFAWCEESILDFADSLESVKAWRPLSAFA